MIKKLLKNKNATKLYDIIIVYIRSVLHFVNNL